MPLQSEMPGLLLDFVCSGETHSFGEKTSKCLPIEMLVSNCMANLKLSKVYLSSVGPC